MPPRKIGTFNENACIMDAETVGLTAIGRYNSLNIKPLSFLSLVVLPLGIQLGLDADCMQSVICLIERRAAADCLRRPGKGFEQFSS